MNPYLRDFRNQLNLRFARDSESMSMSEWVVANTKLRKRQFSFKDYEFQKQIVDDMHPNMCVIKPSQVGLTEVQIRKYLAWLTRNNGVTGIFSLPSDEMYKRVSQTRVGPMVNTERVFNLGEGKPVRSMGLYQINNSFAYFTGAKESDATSISADILFNDEIDLTDQEMMALFASRLQGSKHRIRQAFSTPTYEGFGVDALFKGSDQHEYLCKCSKCNHYNLPEFTPEFIRIPGLPGSMEDLTEIDDELAAQLDLEGAYVRCSRCFAPLDLHNAALREWVPRHPGRRSRGYRVTPFAVAHLDVAYIVDQLLDYRKRDAMRRFHNTVLGNAYNDSNARLSEEEIRAVMRSPSKIEIGNEPVFIGLDMGLTCHLVLLHMGGSKPVVFEWRQVLADNIYDEVEKILQTYNVIGGCVDRNPYTPLSNDLRDLSEGRIVPVEYAGTPSAQAVTIVSDELDNLSHIRGNRTTMIDAVASAVRKRKVDLVGYSNHEALLIQHLRDMVRVERDDQSAIWSKLSGQDHFFHALGYALYSTRVNEALLYRLDADERTSVNTFPVTVSMNGDANMGMTSRRKAPISLGQIA